MATVRKMLVMTGLLCSFLSLAHADTVVHHERTAYGPNASSQKTKDTFWETAAVGEEHGQTPQTPMEGQRPVVRQEPDGNLPDPDVKQGDLNAEREANQPEKADGSSEAEESILASEEFIKEFRGREFGSVKENPYLRSGQLKGIPYYDSVYQAKDPAVGQNDFSIIVRQQATSTRGSIARYYSFIVIANQSSEQEIFTKESLPCLQLQNADGNETIQFLKAWRVFPQAVMLRMKHDTLDAAYAAEKVTLMIEQKNGEVTWIPIPAEVLDQWRIVMETII